LVDFDRYDPDISTIGHGLMDGDFNFPYGGMEVFLNDETISEENRLMQKNWNYSIAQFAKQAHIVRSKVDQLELVRQGYERTRKV
jgi:hypothetical protein